MKTEVASDDNEGQLVVYISQHDDDGGNMIVMVGKAEVADLIAQLSLILSVTRLR